MHISINQWHQIRIQDIWFENKEDFPLQHVNKPDFIVLYET